MKQLQQQQLVTELVQLTPRLIVAPLQAALWQLVQPLPMHIAVAMPTFSPWVMALARLAPVVPMLPGMMPRAVLLLVTSKFRYFL